MALVIVPSMSAPQMNAVNDKDAEGLPNPDAMIDKTIACRNKCTAGLPDPDDRSMNIMMGDTRLRSALEMNAGSSKPDTAGLPNPDSTISRRSQAVTSTQQGCPTPMMNLRWRLRNRLTQHR